MSRPNNSLPYQIIILALAIFLGMVLNIYWGGRKNQAPSPVAVADELPSVPTGQAPQAASTEPPVTTRVNPVQEHPQITAPIKPLNPEMPVEATPSPQRPALAEPALITGNIPPEHGQSSGEVSATKSEATAGELKQPETVNGLTKANQGQATAISVPNRPSGPVEPNGPQPGVNVVIGCEASNKPRELELVLRTESNLKADKIIYFPVKDQGRLIVDFYGEWRIKANNPDMSADGLGKKARLSLLAGRMRLVVDFWDKNPAKVPLPEIHEQPRGYIIHLSK